jgi:hypothetical protein
MQTALVYEQKSINICVRVRKTIIPDVTKPVERRENKKAFRVRSTLISRLIISTPRLRSDRWTRTRVQNYGQPTLIQYILLLR